MFPKPYDYRKTIDLISFDAGHTLVWPDYARLARELANFIGRTVCVSECMLAEGQIRNAHASTHRTEDKNGVPGYAHDYFGGLATLLHRTEADKLSGYEDFVKRCYEINLHRKLFSQVGHDVPLTLSILKKHGFRLCVTSNAGGQVERNLRELGLLEYFDFVLDSGTEGLAKPALFGRLTDRASVSNERILHIGDNLLHDVVGALEADMQAFHYDLQCLTPIRSPRYLYFRSLLDLAQVLVGQNP